MQSDNRHKKAYLYGTIFIFIFLTFLSFFPFFFFLIVVKPNCYIGDNEAYLHFSYSHLSTFELSRTWKVLKLIRGLHGFSRCSSKMLKETRTIMHICTSCADWIIFLDKVDFFLLWKCIVFCCEHVLHLFLIAFL